MHSASAVPRVSGAFELASSARFDQLTNRTREELRLIHNQRLSLQEVATATGSNIEAVKKRMARARLLLDATSTRAAARRLAEHESVSPFGGNHGNGLPAQVIELDPHPIQQGVESVHVDELRSGMREEGAVFARPSAVYLQPSGQGWLRWRRSRPLAALVTACALLLLMVVLLSLVKLCTDLLTLVGPHLGA